MPDIKLSFCIPTYNRADYIRHTLTSIADQIRECNWTDGIEICVSDNASTDNTDELILEFKENYPDIIIVYSKNSKNIGADMNYLKVVEMASGDYCWLFGSDDVLAPKAISSILEEVLSDYDIILCNRIECDINLNQLRKKYWLDSEICSCVFDFSKPNEFNRYLQLSQSLGALFSYLSSIIVNRKAWNGIKFDVSFIGTAYSHAYILLSMVHQGAILKYLSKHFVLCRVGNDSFATEGIVKRMLLDLDGYGKLAEQIRDEKLSKFFLGVLRREHQCYKWLKIRVKTDSTEWDIIEHKLKVSGYNSLKIRVINILEYTKASRIVLYVADIIFRKPKGGFF